MASRHVSFLDAEQVELEAAEDSEESDGDVPEYTESLSEGDCWSSSDDDQAELFERLLDAGYFGNSTPVKGDAVDRYSLLCFDKELLRNEERDGKYDVRRNAPLNAIQSTPWMIYMLHMDWKQLRKLHITVKHSL